MKEYHVLSLSGGKDSTALAFFIRDNMPEIHEQIEYVFYDTGCDLPETYDYLDKSYNKGIEITNIIGDDNVLEMIESIGVTDTEIFDKLNDIIMNDEELSDRLATLKEMNKEYVSDLSWDFPIICGILTLIFIYEGLKLGFFWHLLFNYEMKPNTQGILAILLLKTFIIIGFSIGLIVEFDCGPLYHK